jgi:hypothetical protein
MKKLQMLTTAAGILLALAGPSLAAQRTYRGVDAYASATSDRSGSYYYGPRGAQDRAFDPVQSTPVQSTPFRSAPSQYGAQYDRGQAAVPSDETYGHPDSW